MIYDLGGLPANLASRKAQGNLAEKSAADGNRQRELVALDARSCLLAWKQTQKDLALVSRMLDQAKESERVARERVSAGTASETDLLASSLARLRAEYAILNRRIDAQIAAADLCRAAALQDAAALQAAAK